MRYTEKLPVLLFLLLLFSLFAQSFAIQCTETIYIRNDTTLTDDLTGCPKFGISFAANNITLDCAGHLVTGLGSGNGYNGVSTDTHSNVVIKNCIISAFYYGVTLIKNSGILLENNTITGNAVGIYMVDTRNNLIENNRINKNWVNAVQAFGSSSATTIRHNDIYNNGRVNIQASANSVNIKGNYWGKSNCSEVSPSSVGLGVADYSPILSGSITSQTTSEIDCSGNEAAPNQSTSQPTEPTAPAVSPPNKQTQPANQTTPSAVSPPNKQVKPANQAAPSAVSAPNNQAYGTGSIDKMLSDSPILLILGVILAILTVAFLIFVACITFLRPR